MRRWITVGFRLCILGAFLWTCWIAWGYIFRHFAVLFFYTYSFVELIALAAFAALVVFRESVLAIHTTQSDIKLEAGGSAIARGAGLLGHSLSELSFALCWPLILLKAHRTLKATGGGLKKTGIWRASFLNLDDRYSFELPLFCCASALILFLVPLVLVPAAPSIYVLLQWLGLTIAAATLANHLALLLSPAGFLAGLKETRGSPAAKLALLLALDLTTLTLTIAVITGERITQAGILHTLPSIAKQLLLAPGNIAALPAANLATTLAHMRQLTRIEALEDLLGVAFYAALLRSIFSKGLKRADRDYVSSARRLAARGKGVQALKALEAVEESTFEAREATLMALLVDGHIDHARAAASQMLRHDHTVFGDPTPDDVYFELFELWLLLSPAVRILLIESATQQNLSDSLRYAVAVRLKLVNHWEENDKELVLHSVYTRAIQLHRDQQTDRAIDLIAQLTPANRADEFLKMTFLFSFGLPKPEAPEERNLHIGSWIRQNRAQFTAICSSMLEDQIWSQFIVRFILTAQREVLRAADPDAGAWLDAILKQHTEALGSKRGGALLLELMQ